MIRGYHHLRGLQSLIIHASDLCPNGPVRTFDQKLLADGWVQSSFLIYYPDFGDYIDSIANIVLGIHSSTGATREPTLIVPPATPLTPMYSFVL